MRAPRKGGRHGTTIEGRGSSARASGQRGRKKRLQGDQERGGGGGGLGGGGGGTSAKGSHYLKNDSKPLVGIQSKKNQGQFERYHEGMRGKAIHLKLWKGEDWTVYRQMLWREWRRGGKGQQEVNDSSRELPSVSPSSHEKKYENVRWAEVPWWRKASVKKKWARTCMRLLKSHREESDFTQLGPRENPEVSNGGYAASC